MTAGPATLGVFDDDLVTGDAVALRLPHAGPGERILSGLIDVIVSIALLIGFLKLLDGLLSSLDDALATALALAVVVTTLVVVPTAVESVTSGRSLGRLALGTRIVRTDGGPIAPRQALTRALVGFLEIWMFTGSVATFAVMLSGRGQRLGDRAAGTCCIRERIKPGAFVPVQPVPRLESWVTTADIAPMPSGLALAIRQLLMRRSTLTPQARARIGTELYTAVSTLVAPPPPPEAHPEDVLQAVLAERSRRDAARLVRDEDLRRSLHLDA